MYSQAHRSHIKGAVFNLSKPQNSRSAVEEEDDGDFQDMARRDHRRPLPSKQQTGLKKNRSATHSMSEATDMDFQLPSLKLPPIHSRQSFLDKYVTTPETRKHATTLIIPHKRRQSTSLTPLLINHKNTTARSGQHASIESGGAALIRPSHRPPNSVTAPMTERLAQTEPIARVEPTEKDSLVMPERRAKRRYQKTKPITPANLPSQETSVCKREVECPYCHETLVPPFSDRLQKALAYTLQRNEKEVELDNEDGLQSTHIRAFVRPKMKSKRPRVSHQEQDAFCRMHNVELVVKRQGKENGYPTDIDFDSLHGRILKFTNQLEQVISGTLPSTYRDMALKAYDHMGKNRARSTMSVLARFEVTLPGYYGAKGAAVILDSLTEIFLHSGVLTMEKTKPQLPLEYLQQVLVPEAGFRLIREDLSRKISHQPTIASYFSLADQAKRLMKESSEYGNLVYPDSDENDEIRCNEYGEFSADETDQDDLETVDLTEND